MAFNKPLYTYERKYEINPRRKYAEKISNDTSYNSSNDDIELPRIKRYTLQDNATSPNVIGSDWNDTFDRLKNDGPVQPSDDNVSSNCKEFCNSNISSDLSVCSDVHFSDIKEKTKELDNVTKSTTKIKKTLVLETSFESLNKPAEEQKNISYDTNVLCDFGIPISNKSYNEPIAESTPKINMRYIKSCKLSQAQLFGNIHEVQSKEFAMKTPAEKTYKQQIKTNKENKDFTNSFDLLGRQDNITKKRGVGHRPHDVVPELARNVNDNHVITKTYEIENKDRSFLDELNKDSPLVNELIEEKTRNDESKFKEKPLSENDLMNKKSNLSINENIIKDDLFILNDLDLSTKTYNKPLIKLLPGKKWRRSLNVYIHNNSLNKVLNLDKTRFSLVKEEHEGVIDVITKSDFKSEGIHDNIANLSVVDKQLSYISISSDDLEYSVTTNVSHKSNAKSRSVFSSINPRLSDLKPYDPSPATAHEVVLRRCGQTEPLLFNDCYPDIALQKCHKIGEGLFGEVFLYKDLLTKECSVIKIIPIEGSLIVNGERQKKFSEILSEIIIVMELSDLRNNNENVTSGFSQLKKISCVKGKYPETLLHLWELYEEQFGSENDNPQMFGDNQLYVILELGNGGRDLEAFQFTNAKQSLSIFRQITLTLAVAEKALEFEHRDLHWGNVLIVPTSEKNGSYKINGETVCVPLHGVKATIIDFTFSRITINGQALFSDLGADEELFSADGDYQFDIYRRMRQKNQNNWSSYQPYSNILWLHYLADKMISGVRYTQTKSKIHNISIIELQLIKDSLLSYNNVNAFLKDFDHFYKPVKGKQTEILLY